jgi:spore germination protein GerM
MDGNHKLCRLRCISNFPTVKKKTYLPKVQKLRKSERIANILSNKIKNKYKNKKKPTFKKSKPKVKQACNADLVVKLDSGCDETPVLGIYFCKKHNSNMNTPKDNYNGMFNFLFYIYEKLVSCTA